VDASEEQRVAVDGILDRSVEEGFALMGEREDLHEQISVLLSASEVDREALEALRAQQIEFADAVSRQLTNHLAEIAEVLTPEQRSELAELHERFRR
jgi:protein CpxP